jgi:hypothetical protein
MKNFISGLIVGAAIAVCGYKPYQIEMEYRQNIAAGLEAPTVHCFTPGVRYDSLRLFHSFQGQKARLPGYRNF